MNGILFASTSWIMKSMRASVQGLDILLVDDDAEVRKSLKLLLSIDRHRVTEAAGGHEALALFNGSKFDLVITDYLMPDMLGDELEECIRNIAPLQPILMITAYLEKIAAAGRPLGSLLGKPASVQDLRTAVLAQVKPSPPARIRR